MQLHVTPLHSGELFRRQMEDHPRAWIFTSATLAVGEDFGHFTRELGVAAAQTRRWASPFDFPQQALLYTNFVYNDPVVLRLNPPILISGAAPLADRTLTYCAHYDNGAAPNFEKVKRRSASPPAGPHRPTPPAASATR